jgi:hypothetical protein
MQTHWDPPGEKEYVYKLINAILYFVIVPWK